MPITIGYDLRFALLPHGGKTTCQTLPNLINVDPDSRWVIYHNKTCPLQHAIINDVMRYHSDRVTLRSIRSHVLSLTHHMEFLFVKDNIDVYYYLHFDMPIFATHAPSVITIHDIFPLVLDGYCSALKRRYFKTITAYNTKRATTVLTVSESTKNDLIKHIGTDPKKIVVIPHGIGSQFQCIKDQSVLDTVINRYTLTPTFLLYCGMHKKHKNLERLISAYAQLPTAIQKNYPLVITGKPNAESKALRQQIIQCGLENNIHFIGYVPDEHLPALNTLASLSILPSLYEGFGFTPIESMACGTPAIGSNISAVPEVIGNAGRLFDPYNIEDITNTIVDAIQHDVNNQAVQENCLAHAKQFSLQTQVASTYNALIQAAKN